MPRIFSALEGNTSAGFVDFVNGAAAVPAAATSAIAYFTAAGYTVDASKNTLTVFDTLTEAQLRDICAYTGVAVLAGDTKAQVVRKLETGINTDMIIALTVTSVQTAVLGESTITVTAPAKGATNIYKYKAAVAAPVLLYGDEPDATWKTFASGADITPLTTDEHIAVVECNAAGDFVLGYGEVVIAATP